MKDKSFEAGPDPRQQTEDDGIYEKYQELGGIINEIDCMSVLERAGKTTVFDESLILQAEKIAEHAGIILDDSDGVDQKVKLYAILRSDTKPKGVKYHHGQMSDQRLFAEALRMSGDTEALAKLKAAYHKQGIHCPICEKVVTPGQECR